MSAPAPPAPPSPGLNVRKDVRGAEVDGVERRGGRPGPGAGPPQTRPRGAGRGPGLAGLAAPGASQEGGRAALFTQEGCADSTFPEFTLLSLSLL